MPSLFPLVAFEPIELADANRCLVAWGHQMGACQRPDHYGDLWCHGLMHEGQLCAVTITASLIRENVAKWPELRRDNTVELARLCADRPTLNRAALRLWREFVFPSVQRPHAISYQDRALHTGETYRNDGWIRIADSDSGPDKRSGRRGRRKWIWAWPRSADLFSSSPLPRR